MCLHFFEQKWEKNYSVNIISFVFSKFENGSAKTFQNGNKLSKLNFDASTFFKYVMKNCKDCKGNIHKYCVVSISMIFCLSVKRIQ